MRKLDGEVDGIRDSLERQATFEAIKNPINMFSVRINYNTYGFLSREEAESFARFWNVELPK